MPHAFPKTAHSASIVGQDGILRAGWQPAPLACLQAIWGGLTTRRRFPTCPTTSAEFPFPGKVCGIGLKPGPFGEGAARLKPCRQREQSLGFGSRRLSACQVRETVREPLRRNRLIRRSQGSRRGIPDAAGSFASAPLAIRRTRAARPLPNSRIPSSQRRKTISGCWCGAKAWQAERQARWIVDNG
jgi:hypothetical protein